MSEISSTVIAVVVADVIRPDLLDPLFIWSAISITSPGLTNNDSIEDTKVTVDFSTFAI